MLTSSFGNKTEALSCIPIFPVVGTIEKITKDQYNYEIVLDNFYTFDTSNFTTDQITSIDQYVKTVETYIKNDFRLSEKPESEFNQRINKISLPIKTLAGISLQKGDIIIQGPPGHVCSYGFNGIFTRSGELQYALVTDGYGDYSYQDNNLKVEAGKELKCDGSNLCKMEVNYDLAGESFRLSPGESYIPDGKSIKFITLFDSSNLKKTSADEAMFDWGFGTYVQHLFSFQDSEIKPTPAPEPSPEPKEKLNILQRIWRWFVALF